MQAIITKYHGPANSRGSRVSARSETRRIYVSWDHALSATENHRRAASIFLERAGWGGRWLGGELPDTTGYAFVCDVAAKLLSHRVEEF